MSDTITPTRPANFIAGEWRPSRSGNTYERRNPWRPGEVVGEFPSSSADDVTDAVDAAHEAARPGPGCRRRGAAPSSRAPPS